MSYTLPSFYRPKYIEDGDPLRDDGKLRQGRTAADEDAKAGSPPLERSSSDQEIPRLRWGTTSRVSGKSKTALCITVPARNALLAIEREKLTSLATGPIFEDKSILYTYTSSSSGGTRSASSFGAVGDHLTPKTGVQSDQIGMRNLGPPTSNQPLRDLVEASEVDETTYKILVLGETGPMGIPTAPSLINQFEFGLRPQRRRSLSDLHEKPIALARDTDCESSPGHALATADDEEPDTETWYRQGPSFRETRVGPVATRHSTRFDPAAFTFPKGVSLVDLVVYLHCTDTK